MTKTYFLKSKKLSVIDFLTQGKYIGEGVIFKSRVNYHYFQKIRFLVSYVFFFSICLNLF